MVIIFIKNMKMITTLHYSIDEWEDLKLSLFWSPSHVGWGLEFILKARRGMGTWLYTSMRDMTLFEYLYYIV